MSVKSGDGWTKERDVLEAKIFFEFWRLKRECVWRIFVPTKTV
jgi:hypothetical protein